MGTNDKMRKSQDHDFLDEIDRELRIKFEIEAGREARRLFSSNHERVITLNPSMSLKDDEEAGNFVTEHSFIGRKDTEI